MAICFASLISQKHRPDLLKIRLKMIDYLNHTYLLLEVHKLYHTFLVHFLLISPLCKNQMFHEEHFLTMKQDPFPVSTKYQKVVFFVGYHLSLLNSNNY
ncbi:hypothetical protein SDC9_174078 [bioreactor metagenome]|uniref:Uncharacterized protein n=1 Tax=bioreactor metagenome TaxID=1076179 RepID=A0A645GSQ3_9ZZZZ